MYKLFKDRDGVKNVGVTLDDRMSIPFAEGNTDYANFKREINEGTAQLEDADGSLMTAEQAKQFVKELP